MAAPVGLDRGAVIDAAEAVLEAVGRLDGVGLRPVAERLGVRVQSLYAHVDGADGLRRALTLRGLDALAGQLTEAAIGRSGGDAVAAIVRAYCTFAIDHPGLYDATLRASGDGPELTRATAAVTRPLDLVLASAGLDDTEATHWYRIIFSTVHGFSVLRRDGQLTLDADPDDTVDRIVAMFTAQLGLASGSRPTSGTASDPSRLPSVSKTRTKSKAPTKSSARTRASSTAAAAGPSPRA